MCIIDNGELNRLLENTNLDEFKLPVIASPREQLHDSSQESTLFGSASSMDTDSSSGVELRSGVDLVNVRGLLCFPPTKY